MMLLSNLVLVGCLAYAFADGQFIVSVRLECGFELDNCVADASRFSNTGQTCAAGLPFTGTTRWEEINVLPEAFR